MSMGSSRSTVGGSEEVSTRERRDGLVVDAVPRGESKMKSAELQRLIIRCNIPESWGPRLAIGTERIFSNLGGYLAVSESFFSVGGMRLPYAPVIDEVCTAYELMPSQIPPNGWRFINGLALLCHQFGCVPSVDILRHFLRMGQSPIIGDEIPYFQYRDARYRPDGTPGKVTSWRTKYFFVKAPGSSFEARPWRYPLTMEDHGRNTFL